MPSMQTSRNRSPPSPTARPSRAVFIVFYSEAQQGANGVPTECERRRPRRHFRFVASLEGQTKHDTRRWGSKRKRDELDEAGDVVGVDGRLAVEELVEDDTQRPQVGRLVVGLLDDQLRWHAQRRHCSEGGAVGGGQTVGPSPVGCKRVAPDLSALSRGCRAQLLLAYIVDRVHAQAIIYLPAKLLALAVRPASRFPWFMQSIAAAAEGRPVSSASIPTHTPTPSPPASRTGPIPSPLRRAVPPGLRRPSPIFHCSLASLCSVSALNPRCSHLPSLRISPASPMVSARRQLGDSTAAAPRLTGRPRVRAVLPSGRPVSGRPPSEHLVASAERGMEEAEKGGRVRLVRGIQPFARGGLVH